VKLGAGTKIDAHVGSRIRLRRTLLGLSQEQLGGAMSLTFQQIQKYERGANRIGSSRLYQLGQVLNVPISYFFDDLPADERADALAVAESPQTAHDAKRMTKRETLELVRAYFRIEDPAVRQRIFDIVKAAGKAVAA
jgi:transcriptional regulator with XRE-family HTH domain